ncbi:MAG: glycogen/starch synthase [Verrucomicrobia bacterium]|nr:glycogen/starch synthase [Verrucomicrobiota bacterium]
MKIIMASSELIPFAYSGDLGKNVRTLAVELKNAGHDVSVVLPYYRSVAEGGFDVRPTEVEFQVNLGAKPTRAEILETKSAEGLQVFLVRRNEYFDRSAVYGDGRAYEDNSERFIFFSKAALELARRLSPTPEIIHSHDWTTALIPVLSKERQLPFQTVLTIHDLMHQGSFWSFDFGLTNLPGHYFSANGVEFYGRLNLLKGGILSADAVVLPGEAALFEGFTPEGGYGLDAVLQENAGHVHGIPLGNDYATTNPPLENLVGTGRAGDNLLANKAAYRQALASRHGLEVSAEDSIVTIPIAPGDADVLTSILPTIDLLLTNRLRLIVTGTIPTGSRAKTIVAGRRYPGKAAVVPASPGTEDYALTLAGADLALFPSSLGYRAQPLMAALRYGTIPVVRFRRGLTQLVTDVQPAAQSGNGLVYYRNQPEAVLDALSRAHWLRQDRAAWQALLQRAGEVDFSWRQSAARYAALYADLLRHRQAVPA